MFVLFIRSADVATDSRLEKYCTALSVRMIDYRIAYWQRSAASGADEQENFVFCRPARYGARYANIFNLILWAFFQSRSIIGNRSAIRYVHSVDLDTGLISLLWCKIFGIPFVYDLYDCYSDSRGITGLFKRFIDAVERFVISQSDLSILADTSRYRQLRLSEHSTNICVIENVPIYSDLEQISIKASECSIFKLCYFGNLEAKNRGLEDILECCKSNASFELHVGGLGALSQLFEEAAQDYPNIFFYGAMRHKDGLALMKECDAILGLYYLSVENHRYAAPNKYYEHLLLGRPIITSKGTPPGDKVKEFDTGIAVEDGLTSISNAILWMSENRENVITLGNNAKKVWDCQYADYFERTIVDQYVSRCMLINRG